MRHLTLLLVLLLLGIAAPAAAQPTIVPGETADGELADDDDCEDDGAPYDVWQFFADEGATYVITLSSDDFDAYLRVGVSPYADCEDGDCEEDDDGGGGLDAQVIFHAEEAGRYEIVVRPFLMGWGSYSLTVEEAGVHVAMDTTVWADTLVWTTDTDTTGWSADSVVWVEADTTVWIATDTVVWTDTDTTGWATDTVMTTAVPWAGDTMPAPPALAPGEPVTGILEPVDVLAEDGAHVDEWSYWGSAGETVTVSLRSSDFDALLSIGQWIDGTWQEIDWDDDSGEGTDSELTLTFASSGIYSILAGAFAEGETGEYTLLLESEGFADVPAGGVDSVGTAVIIGLRDRDPQHGILDADDPTAEGRYYDLYTFRGRAGETVTINLLSESFDAYLFVAPVSTGEKLATDDDGGGGTDARVVVTLPEDGEYYVRATSLMPDETGEYTILLERG